MPHGRIKSKRFPLNRLCIHFDTLFYLHKCCTIRINTRNDLYKFATINCLLDHVGSCPLICISTSKTGNCAINPSISHLRWQATGWAIKLDRSVRVQWLDFVDIYRVTLDVDAVKAIDATLTIQWSKAVAHEVVVRHIFTGLPALTLRLLTDCRFALFVKVPGSVKAKS